MTTAAAAAVTTAAATVAAAAAVVTVAAAAVVTMTAAAAAIVLLCRHGKRSNPLTATPLRDGATGAAAAPATTASFQRLRHSAPPKSTSPGSFLVRWDRTVAAGAASPLSPLIFLSSSASLACSA